ncbi:hypothetical protein TRP8649_03252 [Pelagimonas phthalicica]|uniref:Uncharacterized protein n=1 Tax=Pelagimonas phthalicica TaxID=1037362 RepID=A0A238JEM2_9RHOB|nr:hypothetical protein [Pelagimonas phthalicica]TDS92070.1 hypothetical protein CLV87_3252 [Pelagimonas phthalicica]SMX29120.1 hypothetical protein TRP8649_03252 [Pelagimonas phthalicica]
MNLAGMVDTSSNAATRKSINVFAFIAFALWLWGGENSRISIDFIKLTERDIDPDTTARSLSVGIEELQILILIVLVFLAVRLILGWFSGDLKEFNEGWRKLQYQSRSEINKKMESVKKMQVSFDELVSLSDLSLRETWDEANQRLFKNLDQSVQELQTSVDELERKVSDRINRIENPGAAVSLQEDFRRAQQKLVTFSVFVDDLSVVQNKIESHFHTLNEIHGRMPEEAEITRVLKRQKSDFNLAILSKTIIVYFFELILPFSIVAVAVAMTLARVW